MQGEILTAIVTPFKADGSLDLESFRALASHLVENGSDGLVVTGTTGESPTLSDAERFELYEAAVDEVGDRATVVAGTGTYSTEHSVHLTQRAHEIGVDGFLIVTPYYNKPPVRGIVEHFKAVAAVSDRPIVAYNIPAASSSTSRRRRSPSSRRFRPCARSSRRTTTSSRRGGSSSSGSTSSPATTTSCSRSSSSAGVAASACTRTSWGRRCTSWCASSVPATSKAARALDEELRPSIDLLRVVVNPIAIKCALNLLGHEVGGLRLPLVEATNDEREAVRGCLERLGLLQPAAA